MIKKLRFDILTYHFFAIIFLINAIFLLRIIVSWDKYLWAWKSEPWSENVSKAEFIVEILSWRFYSLIMGILIITLLNWKRKTHYFNTILISIIILSLYFIEFFQSEFFRFIFKPRQIIEQHSYFNFLIFGVIFLIFAVILFSLTWKRKGTTHNKH